MRICFGHLLAITRSFATSGASATACSRRSSGKLAGSTSTTAIDITGARVTFFTRGAFAFARGNFAFDFAISAHDPDHVVTALGRCVEQLLDDGV